MIAPVLAVKLVGLKLAIPLTVVLALSIVIVPLEVRALLIVMLLLIADEPAVVPVISVTPPAPPPPLAKQVGQLSAPVVALRTRGPLALTAKVPDALGRLSVTLPAGAAAN